MPAFHFACWQANGGNKASPGLVVIESCDPVIILLIIVFIVLLFVCNLLVSCPRLDRGGSVGNEVSSLLAWRTPSVHD